MKPQNSFQLVDVQERKTDFVSLAFVLLYLNVSPCLLFRMMTSHHVMTSRHGITSRRHVIMSHNFICPFLIVDELERLCLLALAC